ncbi:hypothetical protein ACFLT1_02000 [Bacteroidota bacterium]
MFFVLSLTFHVSGQMESFPCTAPNPELKHLFENDTLEYLYVHSCYGEGLHGLTSSFLMPSGEPPEIIEHPDDPPDDGAYVTWTCRYAPGNLQDGNTKSAWVEGTSGQGIGEVIIVPCLDLKKPAEIWAGYGKSPELFTYNSRPKMVRLVVIEAEMGGHTQYGIVYNDLHVLKDTLALLEDLNGYQDLKIPDFEKGRYIWEGSGTEMEYTYFLGLEILDVYPGSKWDDTCISEIRNISQ